MGYINRIMSRTIIRPAFYMTQGWPTAVGSEISDTDEFLVSTEAWSQVQANPTARSCAGAATYNHGTATKGFTVAGTSDVGTGLVDGDAVASYIFDTWTAETVIPTEVYRCAAIGTDTQVWNFGGDEGAGAVTTVKAYTVATSAWAASGAMGGVRYHHGAARNGNKVVWGGGNAGAGGVDTCYIYNLATETDAGTGAMTDSATMLSFSNSIPGKTHRTGGSGDTLGHDIYTWSAGTWAAATALPTNFQCHVSAKVGDYIYISGFTVAGETYRYNITAGTWSADLGAHPVPLRRWYAGAFGMP